MRHLTIPVQIDFSADIELWCGNCSSGRSFLARHIELDIKGKDVLIVDDIVDTGLTLSFLVEQSLVPSFQDCENCALLGAGTASNRGSRGLCLP